MKKKEIKNTEKTFALKVFTTGEFGRIDLAIVTITAELLETIKLIREKAFEIAKIDSRFYKIEIFENSPFFVNGIDTIEDLAELVEETEIYDITKAEVLERIEELKQAANYSYVDTTSIKIGVEGISWFALDYDDGSITYDTIEISYKELGL